MIADVIQDAESVSGSRGLPVTTVVEVYEANADSLVRFATMLVGPADADDVVADALIRVLDRAHSHRLDNPAAYLYRSVSNAAKNHHRARTRRFGREQRAGAAERPVSGAVGTDTGQVLSADVVAAVRGLSQQQRAVIFLTYWADLRPDGVAEHLGIGEGSVRKQLARARKKLAEVLDV